MPGEDSHSNLLLVIDDDLLIRESIATYLSDSGFSVIQADDGPSGLEAAGRYRPEVVLLDLRMPQMDGLEVLGAIAERLGDTPVIVVTGAGGLKDAIEALRLGAFDFISKPIIDMAILEHAVRKAIERSRLRQENRRYREHLESEIQKRTHELEQRSAELTQINQNLRLEMRERQRAEKILHHSQSRLNDIISLFEGIIYSVTPDYRLRFFNPKLVALIGPTEPESNCHRSIYGSETPCVWCPLIAVQAGQTVRKELQSPRDGRWYYAIYSPQVAPDGRIDGCQAVIIDIQERKLAEESLRQSEAQLREQNLRLLSSLQGTVNFGEIIGKSPSMHAVYRTILKAAESAANVIIYGESGTGKELVAKTIHALSERGGRPFVVVNCGAIPDNLIESEFFGYKKGAFTGADRDKAGFLRAADGGTLFLDEVGEIPPNMQVKLLRAVEGGCFSPLGSNEELKVDIRIVAATHRDLHEALASGQFRRDFYYRIHVIPIWLPPLRERREDIALLIHHFLQIYGDEAKLQSIPPDVMKAMQRYDWPGNVRELQNAVRQYIALQEVDVLGHPSIGPGALKAECLEMGSNPDMKLPLDAAVQAFEKRYIESMLKLHQWHRARAAAILGIDRRTLFRKLKRLRIQ
jgi:DNA-binding NtrC family response regulator